MIFFLFNEIFSFNKIFSFNDLTAFFLTSGYSCQNTVCRMVLSRTKKMSWKSYLSAMEMNLRIFPTY